MNADLVSSLVGNQAPLGYRSNQPASPRTYTSSNTGTHGLRQQIIENINVEESTDMSWYWRFRSIIEPKFCGGK